MAEKIDYSKGIYDAKQLGTPKLLILGAQHMFAMFGATVLVPLLTGLSVSTTLLCAGLGTLLFHFLCKGKVPAFLGSSFAYLGGFTIVTNGGANPENLPYACAAVALSGLVYVLFSGLITAFGIRKMMKFLPACCHGPHHHRHRPDPGPECYLQLPVQLAAGLCGAGYRHHLQHLGQGHGQDPAHPDRCAGLLRGCARDWRC